MAKKKNNINREDERYGLFMSEESFNLDMMYGREFLSKDVTFNVKLYRINIIESKAHKLYGQAKPVDKKFFSPITLTTMANIEDGEQSYLGDAEGLTREDSGNLIIGVYLDELEEKKTEINRGDILEYNPSGNKSRYYEVDNAQNVTDTTSKTIAGFRPYWKRVTAVPVKEDVTPYLAEDKLV